jgi:hypothetical protein
MELTFIGLAQLAIGCIIVLAGGLRTAFAVLIGMGLLGGSAAINLPSLGGSSIQPVQFALLFVYLRILTPRGGFTGLLPDAVRANMWLVLFTFYGTAAALIMPHIFAGSLDVFPMRPPDVTDPFYTEPLQPSSQNITACVYLIGALMIALAAWCTCRIQGGINTVIAALVWVSWLHIALGIIAAVARGTPFDAVLDVFRNASYAQLNQDADGFIRISGLFPETSAFAAFGYGLFAINAELWLRSIRPKATGPVALALFAILFVSTSSTAYFGLAIYVLFFVLRTLLIPGATRWPKLRAVLMCAGGLAILTAILVAAMPALSQSIFDVILQMTVNKSGSESGAQRLFWTMQGFDAFRISWGLGVGPGSYRSSSVLIAILGTMGIIGGATFLLHLNRVLQPARRSTWEETDSPADTVGGAFAIAALLSLIPAAVGSSSPHPDVLFCIFSGAALAVRPKFRPAAEAA